jgi:pimeloyl-ACP methyl ester carboxylesterase
MGKTKKSTLRRNGILLFTSSGALLAAGFYRWRQRIMPRRDPLRPFEDLNLTTADGIRLGTRFIPGGERGAMIIAHPAVTGQRYSPLVELAEMMATHFDVFTFDFRGHGRSGGRLELNLTGPLEDVRTVVESVRSKGYPWVGAVGFSLGGMSVFMHAALTGDLDAVAIVGAPPLVPDVEPYRRWLPAWSFFLRLLGARFVAVNQGGPLPLDVAGSFPDIPLLIVHGENEAFYSRQDLDTMLEKLEGRGELWVIEGAGHTELNGREQDLVRWMIDCRG